MIKEATLNENMINIELSNSFKIKPNKYTQKLYKNGTDGIQLRDNDGSYEQISEIPLTNINIPATYSYNNVEFIFGDIESKYFKVSTSKGHKDVDLEIMEQLPISLVKNPIDLVEFLEIFIIELYKQIEVTSLLTYDYSNTGAEGSEEGTGNEGTGESGSGSSGGNTLNLPYTTATTITYQDTGDEAPTEHTPYYYVDAPEGFEPTIRLYLDDNDDSNLYQLVNDFVMLMDFDITVNGTNIEETQISKQIPTINDSLIDLSLLIPENIEAEDVETLTVNSIVFNIIYNDGSVVRVPVTEYVDNVESTE